MEHLRNYLHDPRNAEYNFALGLDYEDYGHVAAAAGFYVRAAVHADTDLLAYEALLRLANCFTRLGGRVYMCKGILLRAISLLPERPEAYFLLSRLYEVDKEWQEAYTFAVMGDQVAGRWNGAPALRTNVDYPGRYGFTFERAVAGWWIGLFDESLHLLRQLKRDPTMLPIHIAAVDNNLTNLDGTVWHSPLTYRADMYERLRVKFTGAREIDKNYSELCQDMFVLTMLNGKRDGVFLEIGCGDPVNGSNTKLLEELGWTGLSIDVNHDLVEKFRGIRTCKFLEVDATRFDLGVLTGDYDYLQIDIEPPLGSLQTLLRLPFDRHRFAVVTFEHDAYRSLGIRDRSRAYLRSHGYVLVVGDVAINKYESCEDWWVHPELVDPRLVCQMRDCGEGVKRADDYLLGKGAWV